MDRKPATWMLLCLVVICLSSTGASRENAASTGSECRKRREVEFLATLISAYEKEEGDVPTTFDEIFRKFPSSGFSEILDEPSVRANYAFVLLRGEMPAERNYSFVRGFVIMIQQTPTKRFGSNELGRYCIWQLGERVIALWMHEDQVRQFSEWTALEAKLPKVADTSQLQVERHGARARWVGIPCAGLIALAAVYFLWLKRSRRRD